MYPEGITVDEFRLLSGDEAETILNNISNYEDWNRYSTTENEYCCSFVNSRVEDNCDKDLSIGNTNAIDDFLNGFIKKEE